VAGSTLTINGAAGSAAITVDAGTTAKNVAGLINAQTGSTGVTASAKTEFDLTTFSANASYSLSVSSNNTTAKVITFATGALTADGLAAGIKAFNDSSSTTGVTAQLNSAGTGITLLNSSGENITITNDATSTGPVTIGGTATAIGATAIGTGQLVLDSDKSFGVTSTGAGATTDFVNAASASSQLQKVNAINIASVDGAARAISLVDAALANVSSQRSAFGALQSRFSNAIVSLQTTSENLSAARSRIQDADFAAETAQLTRNQILQQAGTAMLAQANQLPNNVLTLLR
jgi:flagellin